ncbi:MAG TPA: heparin lyase I family protein [Noviherbaspirillum sp.]
MAALAPMFRRVQVVSGRTLLAISIASLCWRPALAAPGDLKELFSTDWSHGIDKRIQFQRPRAGSIELVDLGGEMGGKKLVQVTINKDDDYSGVANGTPRAEMSFNGFLHFREGGEYVIDWSMYIPGNYIIDRGQPELVFQIHQGPPAGYPPFALFISDDGEYEVHNRTQSKSDSVTALFGSVEHDRGHVVHWELHYCPDSTGKKAATELVKDGQVVFAIRGVPNAYNDDDGAYLKIGLYKADWLKKPSDVTVRTMYYGGLSVRARE